MAANQQGGMDTMSVTHLAPTCEVTTRNDAIYRDKGNGTRVHYYLFPEYEVHANTIEPGTVQEWHHHTRIIESLYVTAGKIEARWVEAGEVQTHTLAVGDLIEVGATVHTFANPSEREPAEFLVFRFVPDGVDKREIIKNDRHADEPPAAT